jgi:hypothetical protein
MAAANSGRRTVSVAPSPEEKPCYFVPFATTRGSVFFSGDNRRGMQTAFLTPLIFKVGGP